MSTVISNTECKPHNLAVHIDPDKGLYLVDTNIPKPGPEECLILVGATGIC